MSSSVGQILAQITYPKAVGLSLLVGAFYYFNIYDDGSKLVAQINEVKLNTQVEEEKKKETDQVKAEEKAIKDQVGALAEKFIEVTARFPINLKSDEIISTINTLAKSANIRVTSVKKESVEAKELYEEVPLSLEFNGTFNNLLLLLYNIASLERVTNLGDFEFSNLNGDYDGNIKLLTKVIGYKYRKPPEKPVSADESAVGTEAAPPPPEGGAQ